MLVLNRRNSFNTQAPLNRGRVQWLLPIPHLWGSPTAYDLTSYRNHCALAATSGRPAVTTYKGKACWDLQASNNCRLATATSSLVINGEMTASFWMNLSSSHSGTQYVLCTCSSAANRCYALNFGPAGTNILVFGWAGSYYVQTSTLNNLQWYHVTSVRRGSTGSWTGEIWLDGQLHASGSTSVNANGAANSDLGWGWIGDSIGFYAANCKLADASIWNRALSEGEIKTVYRKSRNGYLGWKDELNWLKSPIGISQDSDSESTGVLGYGGAATTSRNRFGAMGSAFR